MKGWAENGRILWDSCSNSRPTIPDMSAETHKKAPTSGLLMY